MLVEDLVVWRAELQDGPVQVPRVVGGEDADVAAPPRVLFPGVLDHLGQLLREGVGGGSQPDGREPPRLHRHSSLGQPGAGRLVLLGHADHFLVELGSSKHWVCRWQPDLEEQKIREMSSNS